MAVFVDRAPFGQIGFGKGMVRGDYGCSGRCRCTWHSCNAVVRDGLLADGHRIGLSMSTANPWP